jgi:hypothetical protein
MGRKIGKPVKGFDPLTTLDVGKYGTSYVDLTPRNYGVDYI